MGSTCGLRKINNEYFWLRICGNIDVPTQYYVILILLLCAPDPFNVVCLWGSTSYCYTDG